MPKHSLRYVILAALVISSVRADMDVVTAVRGVITKLDGAGKTMLVKTADGTEHSIHFVDKTVVHGTAAGAKDTFHGLKEGSEVIAHYTVKGSEKTGVEVDKIGKDGVKTVEGTVSKVGSDGKTVVVKAADGTEHTFRVVGNDTVTSAKDIGKGADKTAKYTVYYTEDAGKKVAHFFEKL
jgi:hypothetical protein